MVVMVIGFEEDRQQEVVAIVMEGTVEGLHPDHDLALAKALQDQESADLPFQRSTENETSSSASDYLVGQSSNTSMIINIQTQLASDEALARQCQALEDLLANTSVNDLSATETGPSSVNESNSSGTSLQAIEEQDNVDPDNMTYEERSSLTDIIGNESRGLSDDLISYLQHSKYKLGFFSRKKRSDECVICQSAYKNGDKLITLPCNHYYHDQCISTWLRLNKACPICMYEVFG